MKKLIVSGLALLLILTGCGSNGDKPSEEVTLKVAGLESGYGKEGWQKVVDTFAAEKGVKVELEMVQNIEDVLRPQIQAGDVPDVIYLAIGSKGKLTDTMISEKKILEITDVLDMKVFGEDVAVKDKLQDGVLNTLRTNPYGDDKTYLTPHFFAPTGLFFNEGLFNEKGWAVPTTWDEMFALGDKASAEGIALFTYPTTGYFDAFFSALLNNVVGPEMYAKLMNYDEAAWASPQTKEAFEIVGKLAQYTHKDTVSQANGEGFTKNQQLILDNKALFIPNGTWLPGEMKDAPRAEGFEWGFISIPKVSAKGDTYASTFTEEVYIPSDAKNVELAKEFITFLYSDKAVQIFAENGGAIQPVKKAIDFIPEGSDLKLFYSVYDNGAKANSVGFAS
ncbi:MAG: carbohydrate ABC transporter substrate-binding protein, partial [Longicatena sp.]